MLLPPGRSDSKQTCHGSPSNAFARTPNYPSSRASATSDSSRGSKKVECFVVDVEDVVWLLPSSFAGEGAREFRFRRPTCGRNDLEHALKSTTVMNMYSSTLRSLSIISQSLSFFSIASRCPNSFLSIHHLSPTSSEDGSVERHQWI